MRSGATHWSASCRNTASHGSSASSTPTSSSSCPSCPKRSPARSSATSCVRRKPHLRNHIAVLPCDAAVKEDLNTYLGVTRILDYAFQAAKGEVVMVDKANAMTYAGALWQQQWKAVAKKHPKIKTRHLYVDAAAMQLVRDPTQFEVIVTGNLFGDILSDLTAELIGGMGIAPSGNINPQTKRGLFEPVHGTAPDIAGRGLVNPIGAILSASMMVRHLGHTEMATAIEGAVESAIRAGECTRDVGGSLSTSEFGDAIAKRMRD